ncbi:RING/U-box superfamily protein [Striga asiatica]|uniref:RING/U-box superfamily protein n=1 Tax=Striga asiatica TaxID=4170 RepID=A0A5A7Q5S2_STRAF|nr:RING/U-box superfamily protein [Striga asiatica]
MLSRLSAGTHSGSREPPLQRLAGSIGLRSRTSDNQAESNNSRAVFERFSLDLNLFPRFYSRREPISLSLIVLAPSSSPSFFCKNPITSHLVTLLAAPIAFTVASCSDLSRDSVFQRASATSGAITIFIRHHHRSSHFRRVPASTTRVPQRPHRRASDVQNHQQPRAAAPQSPLFSPLQLLAPAN